MHSIRSRIILLTVIAMVVGMTAATLIASISIRNLGNDSSEQILSLMCETGQKNLDLYFESIQQSVEIVSGYADNDLMSIDLDDLDKHMERVADLFEKTANNTVGIKTYYYRIDPTVETDEKGFWYVNYDGEGFKEHEVTDINLYDTTDQSALVWFTVPKNTGSSIWLPPYYTENLDVLVLSYNVPIYKNAEFIGVIGIEIDYKTIVEVVNSIELYENGYAFINESDGSIVYHPYIDTDDILNGNAPATPDGLLSKENNIRYTYNGVEKQAVWLPLINGMRLNVTVPVSEINAEWHRLIWMVIIISAVLLLGFILLMVRLSRHITKPLHELTEVAEQVNDGNYDITLEYDQDDEVGLLTRTFKKLVDHLKGYINDLNSLAYGDALTSVQNKSAYDIYMREIQHRIEDPTETPEFAIGVFDCDDLKKINDENGHEKGDMYLKNTCRLICRVFQYSPVFRVGGDEFIVLLQNEDYRRRDELKRYFKSKSKEICAFAKAPWEEIRASVGIATYNPETDKNVQEVAVRADKMMYDDKKINKTKRQQAEDYNG